MITKLIAFKLKYMHSCKFQQKSQTLEIIPKYIVSVCLSALKHSYNCVQINIEYY